MKTVHNLKQSQVCVLTSAIHFTSIVSGLSEEVLKPTVSLPWSESVDEFIKLLHFPVDCFLFKKEKMKANQKTS